MPRPQALNYSSSLRFSSPPPQPTDTTLQQPPSLLFSPQTDTPSCRFLVNLPLKVRIQGCSETGTGQVQHEKAEWRRMWGHVESARPEVQIWAESFPVPIKWPEDTPLWVCFFIGKRGS